MDKREAGWSCGDSEASGSRGQDAWGERDARPSGWGGRGESPEAQGSAFRKWGNWCLAVPLTAAAGMLMASRETLFILLGSSTCAGQKLSRSVLSEYFVEMA